MRKLYLFVVLICLSGLVKAQEVSPTYFDPSEETSEEEILVRLDSLKNKLIHDYYSNNFLDVLKYGDLGLKLAERIDNLAWDVEISKYTGSALIRIKDTLRAQKTFTESLRKAKIVNDSTLRVEMKIDEKVKQHIKKGRIYIKSRVICILLGA